MVVIAIIAAITTVTYSGITQSARNAVLAAELSSATRALDIYQQQNDSESYPSNITDISFGDSSKGIDYSYNVSEDGHNYCLQGVLVDRTYFVSSLEKNAQPGQCDGIEGAASNGDVVDLGNQNTAEMNITGSGGLNVHVNNEWTELTISWDAVANSSRYEVQIDKGDGNWLYVNKNTGSNVSVGSWQCDTLVFGSVVYANNCSSTIEPSVTSVTWNHLHVFPSDINKTLKFKLIAMIIIGLWSTKPTVHVNQLVLISVTLTRMICFIAKTVRPR